MPCLRYKWRAGTAQHANELLCERALTDADIVCDSGFIKATFDFGQGVVELTLRHQALCMSRHPGESICDEFGLTRSVEKLSIFDVDKQCQVVCGRVAAAWKPQDGTSAVGINNAQISYGPLQWLAS